MAIDVGSIIEGKVSGIMPFGAFVALPDNKVGLLHISEASTTYIKDINEHFKVGDAVKVKVIKIDDNGKISLSVKKAIEKKREDKKIIREKSNEPIRPAEIDWGHKSNNEELSFEDMLSKFKQDSDERMLALKRSNDSKRSGGYRRGGNSY